MNSATQMIKWRFYKFQSAPDNIWLQISKLYKLAEKHFIQNDAMQLYANAELSNHPEQTEQAMTTMSSMYLSLIHI